MRDLRWVFGRKHEAPKQVTGRVENPNRLLAAKFMVPVHARASNDRTAAADAIAPGALRV